MDPAFAHLLCSRWQSMHQAITDIEAAGQHFALCRERQLCVSWLLAPLNLAQSCLICCVGQPLTLHVGEVSSVVHIQPGQLCASRHLELRSTLLSSVSAPERGSRSPASHQGVAP